jgi:hypothetical protein
MSELMQGLEFTGAYINDLLITSTGNFNQHLTHLDKVLSHLSECGLKVNASKRFSQQLSLNMLGTGSLASRWGNAPQQKGRSYQQFGSTYQSHRSTQVHWSCQLLP